ncbi:MAG: ferrous iron transport protein A [Deltaproteobacteria bacterium]|nr:ferrous iron transport protein A [Deltaproteobacteria bacterium]
MFNKRMKVCGICQKCSLKGRSLMPLSLAGCGEKLIIMEMRAGKSAQLKLTSLGLCPGDIIEIVHNDNHGRLVIAHNNTRVAVGRGIAERIMVDFVR